MQPQRDRTIFFYTSMQDALNKTTMALDRFTDKFEMVSPGEVVMAGMSDAIQDNRFRRTIGGAFADEAL